MTVFKAANVEDAVALAESFKAEGRYDWFRGQLREWMPSSSLERKVLHDPVAKSQLDEKLLRFTNWVIEQPALAYLAEEEHVDSLFAVLQHYGFPTNYIDFSTEPTIAGFFASDTQSPPEEPGNCVIYCLDTSDLKEFYSHLPPSVEGIAFIAEPVTVNVPNLWRLESQHGHFLFANHPWYQIYDMDRIVFPWSGAPAFPSREQIYPSHKSALEQTLDTYFFNERRIENHAMLRAIAEEQGKQSLFRNIYVETPETYDSDSFIAPLSPTAQWSDEALEPWRVNPNEQFYSTVGRHMPLPLRNGATAPSLADQVKHSIRGALNTQRGLRAQAVEWIFTGLPEEVDEALLRSTARQAWNGMRNLPYTNEDIACAISALINFCSIPDYYSPEGYKVDRAFQEWIPDAIYIEFGYQGDSYSKAYCSASQMFNALDPAWISSLKDPGSALSIVGAFRKTHDPRLMFDFSQLSSIFAREIIPSQLAMKRSLVLYNPADLVVLNIS
ncbi:FRG domain-containing protein [Pseudomonas sp. HN2-3]|uniref:FRG domain-containing protein n=1 Tax=Pseudomonas sp. HN2-3 TaxID=2886360 RepID=UPI001D107606|nr:FRG domain-containing protein [Pseudomonas sp. HN2-3]UDU79095.1 FRG domain-containing protein [Pseudomonas sp. HN2-3]